MTVQMHLGVGLNEAGRMECELDKTIAAFSAEWQEGIVKQIGRKIET